MTTRGIQKDDRGFSHALRFESKQVYLSVTTLAGTLRGLHFREPPEEKLVLCTKGSIYDITVNLETGEWFPLYMPSNQIRCIPRFISKGFAHGFQSLEDHTEVFYVLSELYYPDLAKGIRYDSFGIKWPLAVVGLSDRDRELPLM